MAGRTKVVTKCGKKFVCFDNDNLKNKFQKGKRICSISRGKLGSWLNEVPFIAEQDLDLLDNNQFRFTRKTYKTWKNHLNMGSGSTSVRAAN